METEAVLANLRGANFSSGELQTDIPVLSALPPVASHDNARPKGTEYLVHQCCSIENEYEQCQTSSEVNLHILMNTQMYY